MIPEKGWHPMVDAEQDMSEVIVVRYHEWNKPNGAFRVQLGRWACNEVGEAWAWRPAHRLDGTIYADSWMTTQEFQAACMEASADAGEFDL